MERTVTLENLDSDEIRNYTIYNDSRIAFIKDLKFIDVHEPVRLDAFIVVVCLNGHSTLYFNNKVHELKAKDMLICRPLLVLDKSMCSLNAEFRTMCISKTYIQQLPINGNGNTWDIIKFLEQSPVLTLTNEETQTFCRYYDLIQAKVTSTTRLQYRKEQLDNLLQAMLYEFGEVINRFIKIRPNMFTSGEKLFRDFLDLLNKSRPKPRNIGFYADKLCITSKYLSAICKNESGYTASELINRYLLNDIEYQLRMPNKSIKEICNEMNFPNLSFFGRYVKKHLGLSPKQWREKNV